MLTIKDLAVSKSLDCKEMSAVRGGMNTSSQFAITKGGDVSQLAGGKGAFQVGVGGPATTTQVSSQVDNNINIDLFGGKKHPAFGNYSY